MVSAVSWFAVAAATAAAIFLNIQFRTQGREIPTVFFWPYFLLPFAAGGFHSHVIAATSWVLFLGLFAVCRRNGKLILTVDLRLLAVVLLITGYTLTPLWAADKGMSLYGLMRSFPLLLLLLLLKQYPRQQIQESLILVPYSGAVMTVLSCMLMTFPACRQYLTVYSRLSGFMQYPNTFAAFLLAGLILNSNDSRRCKLSWLTDGILILGILLSGSRICFVLLLVTFAGFLVIKGKSRQILVLGAMLTAVLGLTLLVSRLPFLEGSNRFSSIDLTDSSFLLRFLYWKDAWRILLDHPFGTGYMGYRALHGLYQTGCYRINFVHNGLLQLLMDTGWVPALTMAVAFLKVLVSRKISPFNRLLLVVLLGHCMLDFDLQFFIIWVLLLSMTDDDSGYQFVLKKGKLPAILCICILLFSTWLGAADFFHSTGRHRYASAIMPVHTDSLASLLEQPMIPEERAKTADKILLMNPTSSAAWGAKADAAMASGSILEMIECKKQMIRCNPYEIQEYYDYFRKLYRSIQLYLETGDTVSAAYCANRLLEIPSMLAEAEAHLDPLDHVTIDQQVMTLPKEYQIILDKLSNMVSG